MSPVIKKADKNANRLQRHKRVRRKITGTTQRPRLCVFRSSNNIYAQIIDDTNRVTLAAASSLEAEVKGAVNHTGNKEAARKVGELIAKKAVEKESLKLYSTEVDTYITEEFKS